MNLILVLTCEHAANKIPMEYKEVFAGAEEILASHRGFDPGALDLFSHLQELAHFHQFHRESRLLVEVNRSLHHPQLFSEFTRGLSIGAKKGILKEYYFPYRDSVEKEIANFMTAGEEVLHFSIHTFTPVLNGKLRNTDLGLLFDPAHTREKDFCKSFKKSVQNSDNSFKIRFNYPYLGKADGFTTYLRKKFPKRYMGIELEVNQKFVHQNSVDRGIKNAIFNALSGMFGKM